jgi:4'-phosphopantetheinyl transferase
MPELGSEAIDLAGLYTGGGFERQKARMQKNAYKAANEASIAWPTAEPVAGGVRPLPGDGEVEVWGWGFPPAGSDLAAEVGLLDAVERGRFERLRSPAAAIVLAVSHAQMRRILSEYLGVRAEALEFTTNAHGKPELAGDGVRARLQFNLSHTATVGLLAVGREPLGVDVERVRPIERGVAATHFSECELKDLARLEGDEWLAGFYRCWTRKEAIVKAEGVGVGDRLAKFDVTLLPDAAAAMTATRIEGMRQWYLHELHPAEGTVAALAVTKASVTVRCYAV